MSIYENFASVYDIFMDDIPYKKWICYLESIFEKFNVKPNLILDLCCGTGNISTEMAKKGYDLIGIDNSFQMLTIAKEKAYSKNLNILYLQQDMREFELYGTVDCVISICDSVNYILEKKELLQVFKLVNNYLNPGGLFIFDINTIYKFENILSNNTFSCTTENSAYTLENFYDKDSMINEFYTNFFIKSENSNLYNRFEEIHYEKAYSIQTISSILEKSGLKLLAIYDNLTFDSPKDKSERIFFVAQEITKIQNN